MHSTRIRHVIWDWNGTLLDDVDACVEALNVLLRCRGRPPIDVAQYRERFGFPVQDYYRTLGFDFGAEDWDALAREYHAAYRAAASAAGLRPGVREALDGLRARSLPMSILSASERSMLVDKLHALRVAHFFGDVCGLDDLYAASKLEQGRDLVSRLPVPAAEILLIGDTTHDYEVACALECRCVLIAGGHQAERRLASCGCRLLREPRDLAQVFDSRGIALA